MKRYETTRRYPRLPISTRVYCTAEGRYFSEVTRNISEGGMGVETVASLREGEEFEVEFRMPGGQKSICLRARVVWVRPVDRRGRRKGAGFAFAGLTDADRERLRSFIYSQFDSSDEEGGAPA